MEGNLKMNPPEKILLTETDIQVSKTAQRFYTGEPELFEYHLAPQWHDAVKDPPKEGYWYGEIPTGSLGFKYREVFFNGKEWLFVDGRNELVKVVRYANLPEPPKESEG